MGLALVLPPSQSLYLVGKSHAPRDGREAPRPSGSPTSSTSRCCAPARGAGTRWRRAHSSWRRSAGAGGGGRARARRRRRRRGCDGAAPGRSSWLGPPRKPLPASSTQLKGRELWKYLEADAGEEAARRGRQVPRLRRRRDLDGHGRPTGSTTRPTARLASAMEGAARYGAFAAGRKAVFYDEALQTCGHLHFKGDWHHRILQNFYSFAFAFARPAHGLVLPPLRARLRALPRRDPVRRRRARRRDPRARARARPDDADGTYYALHVRRGAPNSARARASVRARARAPLGSLARAAAYRILSRAHSDPRTSNRPRLATGRPRLARPTS